VYSIATISPTRGYCPFSIGLVIAYLIPELRFTISGAARAGDAPIEAIPAMAVVAVAMSVRKDLLFELLLSTEKALLLAAQRRRVTINALDTIFTSCFVCANVEMCADIISW
jgi:hypothetical protein